MKTIRTAVAWTTSLLICLGILLGAQLPCIAQTKLGLREAVDKALASRASLKAVAEQVSIARGVESQSRLIENPTFHFENQNLRPGQTYGRDVDTYAYLNQPLNILGKRKQEIAVAQQGVNNKATEYAMAQRQTAQSVALAYWTARGAQEARDLLQASVRQFQEIIDYHSSRLSVGAISEQDFLRVRLEGERLNIAATLAAIDANKAQTQLLREMGETSFPELVLTEPLEAGADTLSSIAVQQVLAQRVEMRVANAALAEAQAKARLEVVSARPDLNILYGLKRTQLADANPNNGTNTALAGIEITLPITDRNQGNRSAAGAEVRRQQQLMAATQAMVLADYYGALQEYELRRKEVTDTLQPLRQHATELSAIAQAAYQQGGTDLLRLLDAERAQIDGELAWAQGMVEYQKSVVTLEAAEGVNQ